MRHVRLESSFVTSHLVMAHSKFCYLHGGTDNAADVTEMQYRFVDIFNRTFFILTDEIRFYIVLY